MKRSLFLCLLLLLLTLANTNGQSGKNRPGETGNNKKAARQETPTPTPPAQPENINKNAADEPGGGDEVVKVSTDLVSFPVSVLDRRGRYVFDLKKEDFQIFEDGKPQEVAFFATTEQPFTVVLMLDISRSTRFKITDIQRAAIAFVNQLGPQDKVMIVAFAEGVYVLSDFTSDRDQLKRAISGTRFKDGTSVYDAFDQVVNERLPRIQGRKAIVMFTDGVDTTSQRSYLNKNLRDADELDAIIFPIEFNTYNDVKQMDRQGTIETPPNGPKTDGPLSIPDININVDRDQKRPSNDPTSPSDTTRRSNDPSTDQTDTVSQSPGTSLEEYQTASKYLADLAYRTGGKVEKATTLYDIDGAFSRIAQGLRQQYSIGYYPPNIEKTGVPRKIKVKVTRPDVVVKARETYTIGESQKKKRKSG